MILLLMAAVAPSAHAETSIINIYDANGNLVTGDGKYYEYNDANQLMRVRQGDTIAGPVIAEYFYDFSGQRVKKIENGVVTYYVGKHFEKQIGGANEGNTSYYFGDGGERVAKKAPSGNIYYYHLDHLDGVNVVTDSAGTIVSKTDYLPFGELRSGSSGSEKYSCTGKEKDKTDLYYFEARYNSPEFRHFTQADIAEPDYSDPQDLNRYSYVGNNPLSYVDYDGYKKKKKAKLSKREKWMIAHGRDPDKDKTSLKKAKEKLRAQENTLNHASSNKKSTASSSKYQLSDGKSVSGKVLGASKQNDGNDAMNSENERKAKFGDWGWSRAYRGTVGLLGGEVIAIFGGAYGRDSSKAMFEEGVKLAIHSLGEIVAGLTEEVVKFRSGKRITEENIYDPALFLLDLKAD